jgi:uncharacterized protein with GYD domain
VDVRTVEVNQRKFTKAVFLMLNLAESGTTSVRHIAVLVADALGHIGIRGKEVAALAFGPYDVAAEGEPKRIAAMVMVAVEEAGVVDDVDDINAKFSLGGKTVSFGSDVSVEKFRDAFLTELVTAVQTVRVLDATARNSALYASALAIGRAIVKFTDTPGLKGYAIEFFAAVPRGFTAGVPVPRVKRSAKLQPRMMFEAQMLQHGSNPHTIGSMFRQVIVHYSRLEAKIAISGSEPTPKQRAFLVEWRKKLQKLYVRMIKKLQRVEDYAGFAEQAVKLFLSYVFYYALTGLGDETRAKAILDAQ